VVQGRATLSQIVTPGPAGVQVVCGASGVAQLADLASGSIEALCRDLAGLARAYDVLVLDTGAGISAQVLKFLAMAGEIVVVTTPNLAAVLDAYGVIKAAREARLTGRIGLLVNQAGAPAEVETVYRRIRGCAERFLQFAPALLGSLARDTAFEASNQSRLPLALSAPENPNAARLSEIAHHLIDRPPTACESAPADSPTTHQNAAAERAA
jgi:flagellar biosynthesis protein FlhG